MVKRVRLDNKVRKDCTRGGRWGNRKGIPNKTTTLLKDAILLAAAAHGEDGKGKDELVGYLFKIARDYPKAMVALLGRVLPLHVTADLPEDPLMQAIKQELQRDRQEQINGTKQLH